MLRLFWWLASVALIACSWALAPGAQLALLVPAAVLAMIGAGLDGSSNESLLLQFILWFAFFGLEMAIEFQFGLPYGFFSPLCLCLTLGFANLWRSQAYTVERWVLQAAPVVWVDALLYRYQLLGPGPAAAHLLLSLALFPVSGLLGQKLAWGKPVDDPISKFARAEQAGVLGTPLAILVCVFFYIGGDSLGEQAWWIGLALLFACASWYCRGFGRIWAIAQLPAWGTLVLLQMVMNDYDRSAQARYTTTLPGEAMLIRMADPGSKTRAKSQVTFTDARGKRHVRVFEAPASGPVSVCCNPEDPEDAYTLGVEHPPYNPSNTGYLLIGASLMGAVLSLYLGFLANPLRLAKKPFQARSR